MVLPKPTSARNDGWIRFFSRSPSLIRSKFVWVGAGWLFLFLFLFRLSAMPIGDETYETELGAGTANLRTHHVHLVNVAGSESKSKSKTKPNPKRQPPNTHEQDNHSLSSEDLQRLIDDLRGDDHRLMRWDATRHTRKKQRRGGSCDELSNALGIVVAAAAPPPIPGDGDGDGGTRTTTTNTTTTIVADEQHRVALACEFATFCITDNPKQRALLSKTEGVHSAIVKLVASSSARLSSVASHLVYIASFSNAKNHQAFVEEGAIVALGGVLKSDTSRPIQAMWSAAAVQNLAASYCDTEDDGRCYWRWNKQSSDRPQLVVRNSSLPIVSDGSTARRQILEDRELVRKLVAHTCRGPVSGKESEENPFPGGNAVAGRDEDSPNIVPWAAAGALKNVALESSFGFLAAIEPAMTCLCRMSYSRDWLEKNKARHVIDHTRREDPCWFGKNGDDYKNPNADMCVDRYFVDSDGRDCSEYEKPKRDECATEDFTRTTTAKEACCPCGGGYRDPPNSGN
eukprot:jgi/Psemu1/328948/estExt_fgenesh1_pg.C_34780001